MKKIFALSSLFLTILEANAQKGYPFLPLYDLHSLKNTPKPNGYLGKRKGEF